MQNIQNQRLPLMEAFYTIQGEGFFQGSAAYFIRLGGCEVGCVWCDVKESWDASIHPLTAIDDMVAEASRYAGRLVVITGGEPLMYDLTALCEALHQADFKINIETSGTYPLSGNLDWVCFSPKKFKEPLPEFYEKADELKIIVYHPSDFAWAEGFAEKVKPDCKLYLQPEWSKSSQTLPLIIEYIKNNPKWEISLQIHKFMQIP
jgi:7-carboxy-7-deazaguanine synthase